MIDATSTIDNIMPHESNNLSQARNISICDGFGCNKKFTSKIIVNAGKFGCITLQLCDSCSDKFSDSNVKEVNSNEM